MIRPATFDDLQEIAAMLREMYEASKYEGRVAISEKAMASVIMGLIAGQKQNGPQGSFVQIAEQDGRVVGFMAGVLDRVYHIGDRLTANDVYLFVRPGNRPAHALKLIDAYIEWARANPKVLEIMASWNDTLPGSERIADVYRRKGFVKSGEMWEMRLDAAPSEVAACQRS